MSRLILTVGFILVALAGCIDAPDGTAASPPDAEPTRELRATGPCRELEDLDAEYQILVPFVLEGGPGGPTYGDITAYLDEVVNRISTTIQEVDVDEVGCARLEPPGPGTFYVGGQVPAHNGCGWGGAVKLTVSEPLVELDDIRLSKSCA